MTDRSETFDPWMLPRSVRPVGEVLHSGHFVDKPHFLDTQEPIDDQLWTPNQITLLLLDHTALPAVLATLVCSWLGVARFVLDPTRLFSLPTRPRERDGVRVAPQNVAADSKGLWIADCHGVEHWSVGGERLHTMEICPIPTSGRRLCMFGPSREMLLVTGLARRIKMWDDWNGLDDFPAELYPFAFSGKVIGLAGSETQVWVVTDRAHELHVLDLAIPRERRYVLPADTWIASNDRFLGLVVTRHHAWLSCPSGVFALREHASQLGLETHAWRLQCAPRVMAHMETSDRRVAVLVLRVKDHSLQSFLDDPLEPRLGPRFCLPASLNLVALVCQGDTVYGVDAAGSVWAVLSLQKLTSALDAIGNGRLPSLARHMSGAFAE